MKDRLDRQMPRAAMIVAALSLCVALGSSAYAVKLKLKKNQVKTKNIKKNAVTGPKIADNAVTGAKANESTFSEVPKAAAATTAGTAVVASVDIPDFGAGQNQCFSVDVAVPGVVPGDNVVMTPVGALTYFGESQLAITLHSVAAGTVEVQACLSADEVGAVAPPPVDYKFLILK